MRRPLLLMFLALGALVGFGSGIRALSWHHFAQRAAFERHVAEICVSAARSGQVPPGPNSGPSSGPGARPGW